MRSYLPSRRLPPHRPSNNLRGALLAELSKLDGNKPQRFATDLFIDEGFTLFVGESKVAKKDRASLLAKLRDGTEPISEVRVEAVTYLQSSTPNRKFVRHKDSGLAKFAKSFVGQPFLRDHNSYELSARGGTIVDSVLEDGANGAKQIRMTLSLVKPWAIEGALDGTIDRFSIGWSKTGPVTCSVHNTEVFAKCNCYPGDPILDAKTGAKLGVVQFVFTAAEGTEVSAVNVPAVLGTGVQAISQLADLDPITLAGILTPGAQHPYPQKEPPKMIPAEILAALGLPVTASVADVIGKVSGLTDQLTVTLGSKKTVEAELSTLRSEIATRDAAATKLAVDAMISRLAAAGKLLPGSEMEAALRRMAARDFESFGLQAKDMLATGASVTPAGKTPVVGGADPVAPTGQGALDGRSFLAANAQAAAMLAKLGVTQEQFEKHGASARQTLADNAFAAGR